MFFMPFIGELYNTEGYGGLRLLILGESHYGPKGSATPDYTVRMVQDLAMRRSYRYFSSIQRLVMTLDAGTKLHTSIRKWFWSRVAFYNFIQEFVGDKPLDRPSKEMWRDAKPALFETLDYLKPNFILVTGKELDSNLPDLPTEVVKCAITHPSSRVYRHNTFKDKVASLLKQSFHAIGSARPLA
ncbi:MAG: hypothetical protein QM703_06340 [Gemmatales bacterium]